MTNEAGCGLQVYRAPDTAAPTRRRFQEHVVALLVGERAGGQFDSS
jgi:hypothetical protein